LAGNSPFPTITTGFFPVYNLFILDENKVDDFSD